MTLSVDVCRLFRIFDELALVLPWGRGVVRKWVRGQLIIGWSSIPIEVKPVLTHVGCVEGACTSSTWMVDAVLDTDYEPREVVLVQHGGWVLLTPQGLKIRWYIFNVTGGVSNVWRPCCETRLTDETADLFLGSMFSFLVMFLQFLPPILKLSLWWPSEVVWRSDLNKEAFVIWCSPILPVRCQTCTQVVIVSSFLVTILYPLRGALTIINSLC